jgi:RNA polymerase sigma factor (sigma-70 family)
MAKLTIGKLIQETLKGNSSAQNELYILYKKKVEQFLMNRYNNNFDYHDDVAEILLKIFTNLKQFDSNKAKFDTWVNMIAKNYMIDKSRKKKPIYVSFTSNTFNSDDMNATYINDASDTYYNTTNTFSLDMLEPASLTNSPHDTLEINDSLDHISTTVGIENFSMLTMKYKDGYSYDEIAKEFNSDESKVSNKVNYSKSKIKKGEE